MAEAISLIASVAGLLDIALRSSKALHSLQSHLRNAPDLIRALSNEVADISVVLARVEDMKNASKAAGLNVPNSAAILVDVEVQLRKAKTILIDLDALTKKLAAETPKLKRVKWCLKKSRASDLQSGLKEVRTKINELLVAHSRALDAVIGSLFIGYAGYPVPSSSCNLEECSNGKYIRLSLTYGFPLWFLNYAVHIFVEASTSKKFAVAIAARRRIEFAISEDNILYQVQQGQLSNVRNILQMDRAAVHDIYFKDDRSVLFLALFGRQSWTTKLGIIRTLLQAGAEPDQENEDGISARHVAAQWMLLRIIPPQFCVELEQLFPLSKCLGDLGLTFLHRIISGYCNVDITATLQSQSPEILAQVNGRDRLGFTPLMYAAQRGDLRGAKALIDAGADVNAMSTNGNSTLILIALAGLPESCCLRLTDLLLKAGADVNMASKRLGNSVLHIAAESNNTKLVKMLLSAGARIECRTITYGVTPIIYPAQFNSAKALQLLIEEGEYECSGQ
ncbi:Fc.00g071480.m01.CDS01 [Cosmosporella sp. VM-42]